MATLLCSESAQHAEPLFIDNPLHSARGPLGLLYRKIDSLNQTLINIFKIVMGAMGPESHRPIFTIELLTALKPSLAYDRKACSAID